MSFVPRFTYSDTLVKHLGVIEGARAVIEVSPRTAGEWLKEWASDGLVNPILAGEGVRIRGYELAEEWVETCFKIRASV